MHELIFFIIGCLIGGIIGVITMSLMQINRIYDDYDFRKEARKNEKNN